MALRDEVLAVQGQQNPPRATHPKGYEPGYELRGDTATASASFPDDASPNEREIIAGFELDPAEWEIVGNVNCRRWQTYDERWLRYYKADLRRRTPGVDRADVAELCKLASKHRPPRKPPTTTNSGWVSFVSLNDWQIGKGEGGGTEATLDWLLERFERLEDVWRRDKPPTIYIGNTGDLSEAVSGHYSTQQFTVDLDQREQDRVARRMVLRLVKAAARRAPEVVVSGVPCNHGENRNGDGKKQTRTLDNKTLTYVENVQEACAENPDAYGHVRFEYPDSANLVTDLAGVPVVLNHGHEFGGGKFAMQVAEAWWAGQIKGMQPASAALVMFSAHRHHFQVSEEMGRTILLAPACDGGSEWFTSRTGQSSPRGLLTVKVGAGIGDPLQGERCWADLEVL